MRTVITILASIIVTVAVFVVLYQISPVLFWWVFLN